MEEILASIRRIIEESDVSHHPVPPLSPRGEVAEFPRPVVTESMQKAGNLAQELSSQPAVSKSDVFPQEPVLRGPIAEPAQPMPQDVTQEQPDDEPLLDAQNDDHYHDEWVPPVSEQADLETTQSDTTVPLMESKTETMTNDPSKAATSHEAASRPRAAGHILSETTERQVAAAFQDLNHAVHSEPRRSFDDIAADILRPMLQDWLDEKLPDLVERLVREEIERVVRGQK